MSNTQYSDVTRLTLKNRSLLQRISELSAEHEEKYHDLRVEYTLVVSERDELLRERDELKEQVEKFTESQERTERTSVRDDVSERDVPTD